MPLTRKLTFAATVTIAALNGCLSTADANGSPIQAAEECVLASAPQKWLQKIVDGWALVSNRFLSIPAEPFPETLAFDSRCIWRIAPATPEMLSSAYKPARTRLVLHDKLLSVYAARHDGEIELPSGAKIPADIIAVTQSGPKTAPAYFVIALPSIWRNNPRTAKDSKVEERILSAAIHEIVHVRQLPIALAKIRKLEARSQLPPTVTDTVVESRFASNKTYVQAFEKEKALFFDAALTDNEVDKIRLARAALTMADNRRAKFFRGEDTVYSDLEDIFLNMEGLAEWARFKYHHAVEPEHTDAEIVSFLVGRGNEWLQDEGLAVFILLDALSSDWKHRALVEMESPYSLLLEAVDRYPN